MIIVIFILIGALLAFDDALWSKYEVLKKWNLFVRYEDWFNPLVSWQNKHKSELWKLLTPVSDQKHVNRVILWLLIMTLIILPQVTWWESLICGIAGVYLSFNLTWYILTKE